MENKSIALACRMDSERAFNLTRKIFDFLVKKKNEIVYLETRIAPKILPTNGRDLGEMTSENTKFILSIGGDGTLLRVAGSLSMHDPPPILGVNIGSIGFLDESNERAIFRDINRVISGDFTIESCSKLSSYLVKGKSEEKKLGDAINEVLIVSSKNSKVMQVSIKINGIFLNRSYLDGVIISTSTGSTAYNLSAGGAIIHPSLNMMQLVALNPYARSGLKPIILPIDSEIEIQLLRPRLNGRVLIDGRKIIKAIQPNTRIRIRKSDSVVRFIRFDESYYSRLRKKIIGMVKIPRDDSPEEY
ncbi:MAG: NAD(+)/NADH kinase [Promethearchaeota archaeon]